MSTAEQFHVDEVSPTYWRVTFDNGPVNLLDPDTISRTASSSPTASRQTSAPRSGNYGRSPSIRGGQEAASVRAQVCLSAVSALPVAFQLASRLSASASGLPGAVAHMMRYRPWSAASSMVS